MREKRRDRRFARLRLSRSAVVALTIVALGGLLLALFVGRQAEIARRHRTLRELEATRASALQEQDRLRARLAEANDDGAVEALARERLGLVMPGEEKVIFVEE
jgi:cell division protein FtsB